MTFWAQKVFEAPVIFLDLANIMVLNNFFQIKLDLPLPYGLFTEAVIQVEFLYEIPIRKFLPLHDSLILIAVGKFINTRPNHSRRKFVVLVFWLWILGIIFGLVFLVTIFLFVLFRPRTSGRTYMEFVSPLTLFWVVAILTVFLRLMCCLTPFFAASNFIISPLLCPVLPILVSTLLLSSLIIFFRRLFLRFFFLQLF